MDKIREDACTDIRETDFSGLLDRGIDDMEAGHEMPMDDAFRKVGELRRTRGNS